MGQRYSWPWVETQVARSIEEWNDCALDTFPPYVRYSAREQRTHEKAYDQGLRAVQREAGRVPRTPTERLQVQQRIVSLFPNFASVALGLKGEEIDLITDRFLPVGTELARWARGFDPAISTGDTIQACRNAWSCCGLQALLGQPMELTPSILAYSLLYPYSDNHLDQSGLSTTDKLQFSERFRRRLSGHQVLAAHAHEAAIWALVQLIEDQYPRTDYPQVFDSLLAIHRAQENSIAQLNSGRAFNQFQARSLNNDDLLRISCAKGGTSVLADACLSQPWLCPEEIRFSFDWGVLLQLGDDLQDIREDLRRGSVTLFTRAISQGKTLDSLIRQLLQLSQRIADRMSAMPHGSSDLKSLLRMSWRSLIIMAVADVQAYCSPQFLAALEPCSSFRFNFLRARNEKLNGRLGFYEVLFDAFLEAGPGDCSRLPLPSESRPRLEVQGAAQLGALSSSFA